MKCSVNGLLWGLPAMVLGARSKVMRIKTVNVVKCCWASVQYGYRPIHTTENGNYYIPDKSPYTLPLKRSCNKISVLNVELCILHSDPNSDSQPIPKAPVLYVYVITLFVSAVLPRSRAVAIWPAGMKRKNIGRNTLPKWLFLV